MKSGVMKKSELFFTIWQNSGNLENEIKSAIKGSGEIDITCKEKQSTDIKRSRSQKNTNGRR